MTLALDQDTGTVRCDDDGLQRLLDATATDPTDLGIVPEGTELSRALADSRVRQSLDVIARPVLELRCVVAGQVRRADHRGWMAFDAAAFLLSRGDEESDLVGIAPTFVPAALARLVHLGPRRVGEREERLVPADVLEDVLHVDDLRRASALMTLGADRAWSLDVAGAGEEQSMTVLDGPDGFYLLSHRDGEGVLAPTTSSVLWRRLTSLLSTPVDSAVAS